MNVSWCDNKREPSPQPPAVQLSCMAIPPVCSALHGVMPAPIAQSSGSGGPQCSAERRDGVQTFSIRSDEDPSTVDKDTQWFTLARQFGEGIAILGGDGRLRSFVGGLGDGPHYTASSTCLCAVAFCKAGLRFITPGNLREELTVIPGEGLEQLPAVRKNRAVRVALVADASIIPRRQKPGEPGAYHFDPSVELDMCVSKECPCRIGSFLGEVRHHRQRCRIVTWPQEGDREREGVLGWGIIVISWRGHHFARLTSRRKYSGLDEEIFFAMAEMWRAAKTIADRVVSVGTRTAEWGPYHHGGRGGLLMYTYSARLGHVPLRLEARVGEDGQAPRRPLPRKHRPGMCA